MSAEAKPTPGPWVAHYGWETEHLDRPREEYPDWCEVTGGAFADGSHISISSHMGMANARLIAAAPDQHEAALLIDRYSLVIESAVRNADPSQHRAVLVALQANRAAIAKATGNAN